MLILIVHAVRGDAGEPASFAGVAVAGRGPFGPPRGARTNIRRA